MASKMFDKKPQKIPAGGNEGAKMKPMKQAGIMGHSGKLEQGTVERPKMKGINQGKGPAINK